MSSAPTKTKMIHKSDDEEDEDHECGTDTPAFHRRFGSKRQKLDDSDFSVDPYEHDDEDEDDVESECQDIDDDARALFEERALRVLNSGSGWNVLLSLV
jgi:hypothetical protein